MSSIRAKPLSRDRARCAPRGTRTPSGPHPQAVEAPAPQSTWRPPLRCSQQWLLCLFPLDLPPSATRRSTGRLNTATTARPAGQEPSLQPRRRPATLGLPPHPVPRGAAPLPAGGTPTQGDGPPPPRSVPHGRGCSRGPLGEPRRASGGARGTTRFERVMWTGLVVTFCSMTSPVGRL